MSGRCERKSKNKSNMGPTTFSTFRQSNFKCGANWGFGSKVAYKLLSNKIEIEPKYENMMRIEKNEAMLSWGKN